ncbi:hypothetical protein [uncultured Clostridium sp.]|uniref:hypothetical protein n=1 Tax=uncultured Clostridium sp. TaxID=59620 RepID=UPI0025E82287|nr:hypothetical protein [uncultured Clostridium sp.]
MIVVNCIWRRNNIIAVEDIRVNDQHVFKYKESNGIRMFFENTVDDLQSVKLIKNVIRQILGSDALVINVVPYVNGNFFDGYTKLLYKNK